MSEENAIVKTETENTENGNAEVTKDATETAENAGAESTKEAGESGGGAEGQGEAAVEAADAPTPSEAEMLYLKLQEASEPKTLLKKYLTKNILDKLKDKKTAKGGTLAQCIRAGCENPDIAAAGLYATDPEAYATFAPLFDPVIKATHGLPEKKQVHQPALDLGDLEKVKLDDLDPDGKYVVRTQVRVSRSLDGFAFHPLLTRETREELEKAITESLETLSDEDVKGTYCAYGDLDDAIKEQLVCDKYLFDNSDKLLAGVGAYEDWPAGRGVYHNEAKTLVVWVGAEEHLTLISSQGGADLRAVYSRLTKALKTLEEKMKFVRDARIGFVSFCPSNLGTSLRATVQLNIPTLAVQNNFQATLDKLKLQATALPQESEGVGLHEVSNKRRLGVSEIQALTDLYHGVKELIKQEKALTWKPETLAEMYEHVSKARTCKSLLKKYLTKDVYESLKDKKTAHGATLADCIRSGAWNLDSGVGIYAADPESYTEFKDLFDPIIKDYHKVKASEALAHPAPDFGDLEALNFPDLDPEKELIVSTRIRLGRSHKDHAFPPVLTKEDREAMEKKTVEALNALGDELRGTYFPLTGMDRDTQDQLTKEHFLFNNSDRFLKAAGGYNDWPSGRGIFFNKDKTFLAWVNEEDHLRIISMQSGGDLGAVYKRLVKAAKALEESLPFARDERLGYLTFCPTNLGTTLRASVHIKVPLLSARKDFKATCDKLKLQARGIHGEHTESEGGVFDVSNKRRLGLTEIQAVTEMYEGVKEIIRLEKELQQGKGSKSSSCTIV